MLGAASVVQCHGVLLFRNRPLELRCGAVLRAWELRFGAGFLLVQNATLGSGACLLGAASVLQCHGVFLELRSGAVLRAWELRFGAGFLLVQKATLGSGACLLGAASVLQCHGVSLFRNRPLELRCGAVLRAWELRFGAGFLSVQKATLGSGACLLGAASVVQCHGVLLFRNRPQELRCGAVLRAWELHFGACMGAALWSWFLVGSEGTTLGSGACLLGAASVLQCHGALLFRNRPLEVCCGAALRAWELHFGAGFLSVRLDGMRAALWSWFLVGSEGNRQWSLLARRRFRPSVPWCFAVAEEEWTCSTPEEVDHGGWVRFCGFELQWSGQGDHKKLKVGQQSYTRDLLNQHQVEHPRPVPMTKADAELPEEEQPAIENIRQAQTVVGELLWLSIRTRPDISFAVRQLGRQVNKRLKWVVKTAQQVFGYLKGTETQHLSYGVCTSDDRGPEDDLPFHREMQQV